MISCSEKPEHRDGQGFAFYSEMEFYHINPDNFDPLTLFTDRTCSKLKSGITIDDYGNTRILITQNQIDQTVTEVKAKNYRTKCVLDVYR